MPRSRVLLIGWDAADWKVIRPLLQAGQMPNLARLMQGGVHGNVATIYPVLSPMLWTSIATGKRAFKHGVHGFAEPAPDGSHVRPITILSRKTKAVWNILNQTGHRSIVVGWWPSHPAEPLNGVMVSNHFRATPGGPAPMPALPAGVVHPAALAPSLGELRVDPTELSGEFIRLFVPDYEKVPQAKDKRLHTLAKIIAETMSIHNAATELLATEPWDFAAIYYTGIDHFGHAFMSYHPPRLPWVAEEDFAIYQSVVANAYRYHDAMLGTLVGLADENTTIILLSDHGFHPDHLRPGYIPAEPAGPAIEHRHFGILCLKGPQLRVNERLFGAGLLDICPTILSLFGLPPGRDMDGKVLLTVFKETPKTALEPIESWDRVAGDAGLHPPEMHLDAMASAEAFKQLVDLGYVAPPAPDAQQDVEECKRELKYNLARAYRDGECCGQAAALAEELWERWPKEHRFGALLVECLGPLHQVARRRVAIQELGRRIERYQAEAKVELGNRMKNGKVQQPSALEEEDQEGKARERFEERQLRELAYGRPRLVEWLLLTQALLERRSAEARRHLESLGDAGTMSEGLNLRVAGAQAVLGDLEGARARLEAVLEADPENAPAQAQLAGIHFKAKRFEEAIIAATESLSLLYFQPGTHALLGRALMKIKRFAEAEQELRVAVAQSPRHLLAHHLLGRLYRQHLDRPNEAFAHEGRARALRHELAEQRRAGLASATRLEQPPNTRAMIPPLPRLAATKSDGGGRGGEGRGEGEMILHSCAEAPASHIIPIAPFDPEVEHRQIITVVSGLPRSGTSLMMQLLAAGGLETLTDGKRAADEDNPLGYFELEHAIDLVRDASWLPRARGKVVKIVAQLLPSLPAGEHYHVVFMERNLEEVIASQNAMLAHQGRRGAKLDQGKLMATYEAQLHRVHRQLARRPEFRILTMDYAELLSDPKTGVERVAQFLGQPFDRRAAAEAVRPELRRQQK